MYNPLNFLIANNQIYAGITISDVDLPIDDIPNEIMHSLEFRDDLIEENENEHLTYTPQTD